MLAHCQVGHFYFAQRRTFLLGCNMICEQVKTGRRPPGGPPSKMELNYARKRTGREAHAASARDETSALCNW
jgi:hypothetical protein